VKENTLFSYWLVLYGRKKAILLITLVSVITVVGLGALLPTVYEAKIMFYVPSSSPAINYMTNSVQGFARDRLIPPTREEEAGPYIGLLKSKKIAEYVHEEFPDKSIRKLLLFDVDFEVTNEYMIKLYSRDSDPVLAANVANAYFKYFNQLLQNASLSNYTADGSLISRHFEESERKLRDAQIELKNFQEKSNIISITDEVKNLTAQKMVFQNQLDNAEVLISENNQKIRSYREQLADENRLLTENDFILSNPSIENLQRKLADLTAQIASLSVEMNESHPELRSLKSQHREILEKMRAEVQTLVTSQIKTGNTFYEQLRQGLVNTLIENSKLLASANANKEVIRNINERLIKLPAITAEWNRLNENVEYFRKVYEQLRMQAQELKMQHARPIQYAVLVDSAKPPDSPSFPKLWLNVVVAIMFGLSLGVFYAFFEDYLEQTRKARTLRIVKAVLSETET
jgi:polysaccharide biosynthesis transport protein